MQKMILLLFISISFHSIAQNVGIGTTTPNEKLDVSGNINVSGTIKANGVDGTANQVLMKNSSGVLSWGDMCEYKNYMIFNFTTSGAVQNFTVPAGVTKIKAAVWGGGGKGVDAINGAFRGGCGGGGSGYIEGYFIVTSSTSVQITVGSGANSTIAFSEVSRVDVGGVQSIVALGGGNASFNSGTNTVSPGNGGGFTAFSTNTFMGSRGEDGKPTTVRYDQVSATDFAQAIYHGDGGNAANSMFTAGTGGFEQNNITSGGTIISRTNSTLGKLPGGGSSANAAGNLGGNGRVIIFY